MAVHSVQHSSAEPERHERGPHPALAGIVNRYCGFDHRATGGAGARRREVAQDQVTVIVSFGPRLTISGPHHAPRSYGSFIAALSDSYAVTQEHGELAGIQIDLSPLGAHRLFGLAMHELSSALVLPFEDVLGPDAERLAERLAGLPGWNARLDLLDAFVAARVERHRAPAPDVIRAWNRLKQTGGTLPIGALTAELGCSRRHLSNRFREQIGQSPKTCARLVRFQRVVQRLEHGEVHRLAELAAEYGFYDQSHLNREFRELAGTTPFQFVQDVATRRA